MRGRKFKQESRGAEIRAKLAAWKQMPESSRRPLRALARELGTSHQLLGYYLKNWDKLETKECYRRADEIHGRAMADGRPMTSWEEREYQALNGKALWIMALPGFLRDIERIGRDAELGPIHPTKLKMVKLFVKLRLPGANQLLQRCNQAGLKPRKPFAQIVRETPRLEPETPLDWMRRLRIECNKYATKSPSVWSFERLERLSRSRPKTPKNNLPSRAADAAKSFR